MDSAAARSLTRTIFQVVRPRRAIGKDVSHPTDFHVFVTITGASKGHASNASLVNGVFDLVFELYNGRPLFRKRDNTMVWLRYCENHHYWVVSGTEDKDANTGTGYAFRLQTKTRYGWNTEWLPPKSGWEMGNGPWGNGRNSTVEDGGITAMVTCSDEVRKREWVSRIASRIDIGSSVGCTVAFNLREHDGAKFNH